MDKIENSIDKMGGALVIEDLLKIVSVISYIKGRDISNKKIIIVSALKNVTRLLVALFDAIIANDVPKVNSLFLNFRNIHTDRARSMFRFDCRYIIKEMDDICFSQIYPFIQNRKYLERENMSKEKANLLKYGELCSSIIMKNFLKMFFYDDLYYLDARDCIIANANENDYTNALVDLNCTLDKIDQAINSISHKVILTEGFIARDIYGNDSLMGFDSSDLTASLFARYFALKYNSASLSFWKDVCGVYENPNRELDGIFSFLTTSDYSEFSKENCVPVLPKAIELLSDLDPKKISINIRSFLNLQNPGTLIKP